MSNPETRKMMLQIAETYERMIVFQENLNTSKRLLR